MGYLREDEICQGATGILKAESDRAVALAPIQETSWMSEFSKGKASFDSRSSFGKMRERPDFSVFWPALEAKRAH